MPDSKMRLDDDGRVLLDPEPDPDTAHLDPAAVVACPTCDDDGYRNGLICDHEDHEPAARRGKARIDEILARKGKR
ncbi:MAG: hypothetical protein ACPGVG_12145 [Mycobacterium sp.]